MMTKADFEEIAAAIAEAKRVIDYAYADASSQDQWTMQDAALAALETATKELATACARRYKGGYGFKRQAFVEAAGFPEA